jgi:hypothetical protein
MHWSYAVQKPPDGQAVYLLNKDEGDEFHIRTQSESSSDST